MRRPERRNSIVAAVMMPRPPSWINTDIAALPKGVNTVAVSTVMRPVTQTADAAVKSASIYGSDPGATVMPGKERTAEPTRMAAAKLRRTTWGGDSLVCMDRPGLATAVRGLLLGGQRRLGFTGDLGEHLRFPHGKIREHLSVQIDVGLLETVYELVIAHAVLAGARVNSSDPQLPEVTLA